MYLVLTTEYLFSLVLGLICPTYLCLSGFINQFFPMHLCIHM